MTFRLYTGNRLELLADELAKSLAKPLQSPFEKDIIIVQSAGMERWISMQLAKKHLICANVTFPYPKAFLNDIFSVVTSQSGQSILFDPEYLTWIIMELLPECLVNEDFEVLNSYLSAGNSGELKLYQLSSKIADAFDQYLLFRPDMIFGWEKGEEQNWQAQLWRKIVNKAGSDHRASLGRKLLEMLKGVRKVPGLPSRVSVFGISSLPPFFLEVLNALSAFTEVSLYLMNPCQEFWGDIQSNWEIRNQARKIRQSGMEPGLFSFEQGNSLLASMGTMGRDWFDIIAGLSPLENNRLEEYQIFQDSLPRTLLGYIQSDILRLEERKQGEPFYTTIAPGDDSITIHSCHSPMREVEVLHDALLNYFQNDSSLNPADIVVMAPDIETYAPYIDAVFNRPEINSPERIPFSIADRSIRRESTLTDTFLKLLDLRLTRFGALSVLEILKDASVQRKFSIPEYDMELIHKWVDEAGIRWALDAENRSQLGLPPTDENTWRSGLKRLLLGYAMPGFQERIFEDILPYDNIEGEEAALLGRFIDSTENLFKSVKLLNEKHTLEEWAKELGEMLAIFFLPDNENETELQLIREALNRLKEIQTSTKYNYSVDAPIIRMLLNDCLEKESFGTGFINGSVTFCSMLPMRSIPFRIICLLGMNNDAYPRQSRPPGFDLISKQPRRGDRSRRNDDRYLFLETIISARDRLYISYIGQSVKDNSIKPPSVLVSELIDYINQGFNPVTGEKSIQEGNVNEPESKTIIDQILVRHRLQAFSPNYFNGKGPLYSYSKENLEAALCLTGKRSGGRKFLDGNLEMPEEDWLTVDISELISFFSNPAKYLLNNRLRIFLEDESSVLKEKEIFSLEGLEKYSLEDSMLEKRIEGTGLLDIYPAFRSSGRLPHGIIGKCVYRNLSLGIEAFASDTMAMTKSRKPESAAVSLSLPPFTLTGRIDKLYPDGIIHYRYAQRKPKDLIRLYISHLALSASGIDAMPSRLICLNDKKIAEVTTLKALKKDESRILLEKLLNLYSAGLLKPLPFFPLTSMEFFQAHCLKAMSIKESLLAAEKVWKGNDFSAGESGNPYFNLCFKYSDPLSEDFCRIAVEFYEPLTSCLEEEND